MIPMDIRLRPPSIDDLPAITEIRNYHIINTHITFDVEPYQPEQLVSWFSKHSDGKRYRLVVACHSPTGVLAYACIQRIV